MRSMKQIAKEKLKARHNRTAFEEVEEDLRLSLHLQDEDSVKDTIPDQQLDFKQLLVRYKGNVRTQGMVLNTPKVSCRFYPTMIQKNRTFILW